MSELYDVALLGAGVIGLACAQSLARRGFRVLLVERRDPMRPCLRAEKFDDESIAYLRQLGFAGALNQTVTPIRRLEVYFRDRLTDRTVDRSPECSAPYHDMVNALRVSLDSRIRFCAPVDISRIEPHATHVSLVTSDGTEFRGRLLVLSTGVDRGLTNQLELTWRPLHPCASYTVGFSLDGDLDAAGFHRFDGLTIHLPVPSASIRFASFFRMIADGLAVCRANVFLGPDLPTEFRRAFWADPVALLSRGNRVASEFLSHLTLSSAVNGRRVEFRELVPPSLDRIVCIGDVFAVVDPAVGDGIKKGLLDVRILTERYVPMWFASGDLSGAATRQYYSDSEKSAAHLEFVARTQSLHRLCHGRGLMSRMRRAKRAIWDPVRTRIFDALGLQPGSDRHHQVISLAAGEAEPSAVATIES